MHGCRQVAELAYGEQLVARSAEDEFFGDSCADKLIYYPTVTREPFRNRGRITDLITTDRLFADIGLSSLDLETDRIMLCGSPNMLEDLRVILDRPRLHRRQPQRARPLRDREGVRGALRSMRGRSGCVGGLQAAVLSKNADASHRLRRNPGLSPR